MGDVAGHVRTDERTYRAEDGLDGGGARGVGDVDGLELLPQRRVVDGVAAADAAVAAEAQRRLAKHQRHPCMQRKLRQFSSGRRGEDEEGTESLRNRRRR